MSNDGNDALRRGRATADFDAAIWWRSTATLWPIARLHVRSWTRQHREAAFSPTTAPPRRPSDPTATSTSACWRIPSRPTTTAAGCLHFSADLAHSEDPRRVRLGRHGLDRARPRWSPRTPGSSTYLLMTKYNNYAGDGRRRRQQARHPRPERDDDRPGHGRHGDAGSADDRRPDARPRVHRQPSRTPCGSGASTPPAVDPATDSILANSEDGKLYRWDLTTNTFTQAVTLTPASERRTRRR